jgi:hypothetical protein
MHKLILTLALAVTVAIGATGTASAWERKVTIDTNRGTITGSAEVYCFAGACYREAELTGVNGNTLRHSGMCVRAGQGHWDCKGTVTGPEGNSRSRRAHIVVY